MPTLRQRIRSRWKHITNPRDVASPYVQHVLGRGSVETGSGMAVNAQTALSLAPVYRCISLVADIIASSPRRVVQLHENGGKTVDRTGDAAHTVADVTYDDLEVSAIGFLLTGNGFLRVHRNARGGPERLEGWPYPKVSIEQNDAGAVFYRLRDGGVDILLPAAEIAHAKYRCVNDPRWGVSPLETCAESLGMALGVRSFAAAYLRNSTNAGWALTLDGQISDAARSRLAGDWNNSHMGTENQHRAIILEQGMKAAPLETGTNAQNAQLTEVSEFYVAEVGRVYGVPVSWLNQPGDRASTSAEESRQLVAGIRGTVERFAESISRVLFTRAQRMAGWRFEIDLSELLVGQGQERAEYVSKLTNGGIQTPNEARARMGLPPIEGGDTLRSPVNTIPLEAWGESGPIGRTEPEGASEERRVAPVVLLTRDAELEVIEDDQDEGEETDEETAEMNQCGDTSEGTATG